MALYAIGDIQGCHAEFLDLLSLIGFSAERDRLWLVGDLVNRGPASLAVLREVIALGDRATAVLGNHDFHLLTIAAGHRRPHRGDTLSEILEASDRDDLIGWLVRRPLAVAENGWLMVHAGVLPQWDCPEVLALAREVEAVLASDRADAFLGVLYGDEPAAWREDLEGWDRLRAIVNALTRLRFCTAKGRMEFHEKRGAKHAPEGYSAWFHHGERRTAGVRIVCGHWSTLGLTFTPNVAMLDSGCLWGGSLTALRLDDLRVFQVPGRAPIALL